jgi:hypothetical protein
VSTTTTPAVKPSQIKGLTMPEFAGVSTPTLRAWLRYWKAEDRCKGDKAITADRPRLKHVSLIEAEITAREAARKA